MISLRKGVGALSAATLILTLLALGAAPAHANHVDCGDEITSNTTLDSDVGPCSGHGLVVTTDNVTLNLNGHRVFANNVATEQVGILLDGVSGVTVTNGTVEGFDAGIAIEGGSGNTVERMIVANNVNDRLEPEGINPRGPFTGPEQAAQIICTYGDGITTFGSDNNRIQRNWVRDNGPFGGITLVGDSDGNRVNDNRVEGNNELNLRQPDEQVPALCGASEVGRPGMTRGREVQAIGIRVEGPGATNNMVQDNRVDNSAIAGISVHSYVCIPPEGFPDYVEEPNENNTIARNNVTGTGDETWEIDPYADGISLIAAGPIGRVTCAPDNNNVVANVATDNRRNGIFVGTTSSDNVVQRNLANNNDDSGIRAADGAVDNVFDRNRGQGNDIWDGADLNENCDNNRWSANQFMTVNQECVDPDATVVAPPVEPAGASASASASASVAATADDSGINRGPRSS